MNSVKINEKMVPPTMTTPMPILLLEAAPMDSAIGNAPNAIARLVINIGLNLDSDASMIASYLDTPFSRN